MRSDIGFIPSSVLQEASYEEDILCSSLLCDKRWHLFLKYRKEKDVFGIVYFKTFLEFLLYANSILLKYFTPKPRYLKHLALNRLFFVCHRTGELHFLNSRHIFTTFESIASQIFIWKFCFILGKYSKVRYKIPKVISKARFCVIVFLVHIPDIPTRTVPQLPNSLKTISLKKKLVSVFILYFIFSLGLFSRAALFISLLKINLFQGKLYLRSGGERGISFLLRSPDL